MTEMDARQVLMAPSTLRSLGTASIIYRLCKSSCRPSVYAASRYRARCGLVSEFM